MTDQELAQQIRQAVNQLNQAIWQAYQAGLTVEITVLDVDRVGAIHPYPQVRTTVKRIQVID